MADDQSQHEAARRRIVSAVALHPEVALTWRYSSSRPLSPISVEDLIACYVAIQQGSTVSVKTGSWSKTRYRNHVKIVKTKNRYGRREVGFTRERMARILACPKAKATGMMRILLALGLTEVLKNYSAGRHGIIYAPVPEDRQPMPRPLPRPADRTVAPDTSDPFDDLPTSSHIISDPFKIARDGSNIRDD